jgi:hypothetical protein
MPKENFYGEGAVDGDKPDVVVEWGITAHPQVLINGKRFDRSGINRLIHTLRKSRNVVYGPDE